MSWQPIETAPKDRDVLLAFAAMDGGWDMAVGFWDVWEELWVSNMGYGPSNWMPLPAAPSAEA